MSEPECICGMTENGFRYDIVCPKHDGDFSIPIPTELAKSPEKEHPATR